MVSMQQIEKQLDSIGCNFKFWGRSEVRELANVLMPEEQIAQAVNGSYEGGFALLCVTNYRVLLIDRKPMMLTIEDIRYDMLAEVDFFNRLFGATIRIMTPMRNLEFRSWSVTRLRKCLSYVQQRVMELRQHGLVAAMGQTPVNGIPQLVAGGGGITAGMMGKDAVGNHVPINPYTKVPLMLKRRRFPSFY